MPVIERSYKGPSDLQLLADLARMQPITSRHVIDLPWRLSSPALYTGRDARFWEDEHGVLVGFATWQLWWAVLDYFIRPGVNAREVEDAIFDWAAHRFKELDQERGRALPYWVEYRDDDVERKVIAERHGFTLDDDFFYVQMQRPLDTALSEPAVPQGFSIRPLRGEQEVAAYAELHRTAFQSTSMTPEWRRRTLDMPQYTPELDIIAVGPDDALVGFCVGWLDKQRKLAQIEPLGVHPDYQHQGLGHALLREMLRRFRAHGSTVAFVETESSRYPVQQAYQAVGFRIFNTIIRKGKWFS
jgi:mycothiol synthase